MTVTYEWRIRRVEANQQGMIHTVLYELAANYGDDIVRHRGRVSIQTSGFTNVTPLADVTLEQLVDWVESALTSAPRPHGPDDEEMDEPNPPLVDIKNDLDNRRRDRVARAQVLDVATVAAQDLPIAIL